MKGLKTAVLLFGAINVKTIRDGVLLAVPDAGGTSGTRRGDVAYLFFGSVTLHRDWTKRDASTSWGYTEYSNDILFKVLQKYPKQFVDVCSEHSSLNMKCILSEIRSPILDYNVKHIIRIVDSANKNSETKRKIIFNLKKIPLDKNGFPK